MLSAVLNNHSIDYAEFRHSPVRTVAETQQIKKLIS